jgi:hypothetical protein
MKAKKKELRVERSLRQDRRPTPHRTMLHRYFKDLKEGARFNYAGSEYVKTARVIQGVSIAYPSGLGFSNVIRLCDGQISGMGDLVEITQVRECDLL